MREHIAVLCGVCGALAGGLFLYHVVFTLLPVLMKLFNRREDAAKAADCAPSGRRYAVLIAARNEEKVLPKLLESISGCDYPKSLTDVYVVADNCTDGTARAASRLGARVFERFDEQKVGKGYALEFLLDEIKRSGEHYDAFIVVDADNLLDRGYISAVDRGLSRGYRAVCGYRNSKNFGSGWLSASYALWYLHESAHLNRCRMLFGTSCFCTGTGFAFTSELIDELGGWRFHSLTEDIEFDCELAVRGIVMGYCGDAVLYDEQPEKLGVSIRQRKRWVQGGLQIAPVYGGRLLKGMTANRSGRFACFDMFMLSLWGYVAGALGGLFGAVSGLLLGISLGAVALSGVAGALVGLWGMAAATAVSEWDNIHAPVCEKITGVLCFPLFGITYVAAAAAALFTERSWQPVEHTVATDVGRVMSSGQGCRRGARKRSKKRKKAESRAV